MALDKEYFDSLDLGLVRFKSYNAARVKAVLDDIRQQAQELMEENSRLKAQLDEMTKKQAERKEEEASAQTVYDEIVERANACAVSILQEARQQHDELLDMNIQQQDYALKCVEGFVARLKEQQLKNIEMINLEWQSFLCGLDKQFPQQEKTVPADLDEKISAIERELRMINEEK